jgi:2-polyprenyl-3-methyl-5-hydroxy-6-metoxy-1,4-benzoquinol methylase
MFPFKKHEVVNEPSIRNLTRGWNDELYLELILKSITQPTIDNVRMPGFPSEDIQKQFVGSTREHALREGYVFFQLIKRYCESLGVPVGPNTRVLDFGCGWGRISRFFFKDIESENFYGVDVDSEMISLCKSSMPCGTYSTVSPEPPMAFDNNSLDVIFAYSVFSHLAEPVALAWIKEFTRVLKPNGILLATTQGRAFLDYCKSLQAKKDELEFGWHKVLAHSFMPIEEAKRDYDSGKFLYSATGGGGPRDKSFYGEALIPKRYVEQSYSRFLTLRDFFDDPARLPQALFVMQKSS